MASPLLLLGCAALSAPLRPADGTYSVSAGWTQLGPNPGKMLWAVASVPDTDDWFLRDTFLSGHIQGSYQQFWVSESADRSLTYCGHLRHWAAGESQNADSDDITGIVNTYAYNSHVSSSVSNVWCADPRYGGCSVFRLNITVISSASFSVKVELSPGVVHFDAVMSLTHEEYPNQSIDHRICQVTMAQMGGLGWDLMQIPATTDGTGTFPYAGKKKRAVAAGRAEREYAAASASWNATSGGEFCYKLHNESSFTVSWVWKHSVSPAVDTFYLNVSAEAKGGWVALGFYPTYPGMLDAKILAGVPGTGAHVMQAEEFVGTPVASNWTTLRESSVAVMGDVTNAYFVFDGAPAFNLPLHDVFWAFGQGQGDSFEYHGANRGVVSLDLKRPSTSLPSWMKC